MELHDRLTFKILFTSWPSSMEDYRYFAVFQLFVFLEEAANLRIESAKGVMSESTA